MLKIKVSYQDQHELIELIRRLQGIITSYKLPREQTGAYKRAYIDLDLKAENVQKY